MKRFFTAFREILAGKPASLRSSHWETVRKHFLQTHQACAACNTAEKLQVHHIKPFHLHPELELDPTNLIALCENTATNCHLHIGHHGDWKNENQDVVSEAAKMLAGVLATRKP